MKGFVLKTVPFLFVLVMFIFAACSNQQKVTPIKQIASNESNLTSNKENCGWWKEFKKWCKDHTGTQIGTNCGGNYNCGPCPGICAFIDFVPSPVDEGYVPTPEEYTNDVRVYKLAVIDETHMIIAFENADDWVYEGNFYVSGDRNLGAEVAALFGKQEIVIKAGVYPVCFSNDPNGEAQITVTMQ